MEKKIPNNQSHAKKYRKVKRKRPIENHYYHFDIFDIKYLIYFLAVDSFQKTFLLK